jgi:hypothetical protein
MDDELPGSILHLDMRRFPGSQVQIRDPDKMQDDQAKKSGAPLFPQWQASRQTNILPGALT